MEYVKELLKKRANYLLQVQKEKEEALAAAPEGTLRICNSGNRTQYYYRTDPKDCNGIYIREQDIQIAQDLAQKDYNKRVLQAIEKETNVISRFLANYPETNAEQIYETIHKERQKLVKPIRELEEEFVRCWESVKYQGKGFYGDTPAFYTVKGERVRSKSELIIADLLHREGIPYRYEYPVYFKGLGEVYPDFTVLNVKTRTELYWEHLGMMDDASYADKALQKIETYQKNGIFPGEKLILTYETKKNPLSQKQVMLMIRHYLQ